jgi:hypothetical protein
MFAHSFVPHFFCYQRVNSGLDQGAYYHNLFLRGRPDWVNHIRRQKVKSIKLEGSNTESSPPNFYQMEFCFYSCVSPLGISAIDNQAATATLDLGRYSDNDMLVDCLAWGMASLTNDPLLADAKASGFMDQQWDEPGFDEKLAGKEPPLPLCIGPTGNADARPIPPTSKSGTTDSAWSYNSCLSSPECAALPLPYPASPRGVSTGRVYTAVSSAESPTSVRMSLSAMSLANNNDDAHPCIPERCLVHYQSPSPCQLKWQLQPQSTTLKVQTRNDDSLATTGHQDTGLSSSDMLDNMATSSSSSSSSFACSDRQGDPVEFEGCTFHFVEYTDRDLDVNMAGE